MSKKKSHESLVTGHESKVEELTIDLQRVQADFNNYRRRSEEGRGEILDLAKQEVVMQVLPLLDNIDRALGHLPEDLKNNPWAEGVAKVAQQSQDILKSLGVEKIASLGQHFDHNLHEAISMEDGDGEDEVVVEELQPGYKIGERIIRPAMVKVRRK